MLTAGHHPCQALADLHDAARGASARSTACALAYVGDGNNVARSLAILGALAGVEVAVASPDGYQLEPVAGAQLTDDPPRRSPARTRVYTDVWVSMGDEATADARRAALAPYRVDDALLDRGGARRDRAALPARPPRRGDHRRGPLRRAPAHLGPGREPPPRPEGAARAAARR